MQIGREGFGVSVDVRYGGLGLDAGIGVVSGGVPAHVVELCDRACRALARADNGARRGAQGAARGLWVRVWTRVCV